MHGGLTTEQATQRRAAQGPNALQRAAPASPWRMLRGQFASPIIWLLAGACVISAALGELADAIAIGTIVVLNALVGFAQEFRADRAVLALRTLTAPRARVLRDGHPQAVPAVDVVVGDLLLLEAGDIVAADARVLTAHRLAADEAALTGESEPSAKSAAPTPPDAPLAERHDAVFMGTHIADGTGTAEIVATGAATELGKIADLLATAESGETPLQKRLAKVSQTLLVACLGIVVLVAILGLLHGLGLFAVFLSAVSLAVAAVPEGLPAIVTIALAVGVQRMVSRHVLVRRLPAVETLGCATVICTDKTGTLTTGRMTVRELWGPDHDRLLAAAAANCDAELSADERGGIGDTTELAILRAAAARGVQRAAIEQQNARVAVNPFDAERKCMSVLRADGVLYVKGAAEVVLAQCTRGAEGAAEIHAQMAGRGLRVLAVATGRDTVEANLQLVGLIGLADPPRPEAIAAVAAARAAGIRTVMITGDHPRTAEAIAREMGIVGPGEEATAWVHARATPSDKLRIINELKASGAIVAMTGDGVNDAPALREAHIGICMGKTGTEVTREAAAMVLTDDNFASIVEAIREGRGIFDNIRKALVYLLSGNAGELAIMLLASLFGLPLPLLPLHLLWINLVTDGLPALALVLDPADPAVMRQPPRRPDEPILGRAEWRTIALTGALQTAATLGIFVWALRDRNLTEARNLAFSVIVFAELFRAFASRSATLLFWEVGAFGNLTLLGVVLASALAQLAILRIPATQTLFQIGELSWSDGALALAVSLLPVTGLELAKLVARRKNRKLQEVAPRGEGL